MDIKRSHRKLIFGLIVIGLVVVVFSLSSRDEPIPVRLHNIDKGLVESTVANTRAGTVKACRRAKLAPAMGGQVTVLAVKEGDKVKQDQLLMEFWNEDLKAQVSLAKREFDAAEQSAIEACLMADEAERNAARISILMKENLTTEENTDKAKTNAKAGKAACSAARSRAKVSESRIEVAQASLERTRLRAPFAGSIAEINGEIGEYVTPSPPGIITPPAIDIVDTSCLFILAPIDEVDAPAILEGMEARITLDAFDEQKFLGAVRRVAPYVFEAEKQARTVDIEAVFMDANQYKQLLPGYSADLEIILDTRYDVIRVPTEALIKGNKVLVFDEGDDVLIENEISVGLSNWQFTEVIKGLSVGDRIALSIDREGVVNGAYVRPENNTTNINAGASNSSGNNNSDKIE